MELYNEYLKQDSILFEQLLQEERTNNLKKEVDNG